MGFKQSILFQKAFYEAFIQCFINLKMFEGHIKVHGGPDVAQGAGRFPGLV